MSDILGIGSSGITAYQRALSTVSNNIANANTVGYSRQDVSLSANAPQLAGSNYLGTGAVFNGVRRQYDAFVESNLRNSNSALQSQEPMVSYVNRLINVMGDQSIGLTAAMNQFFTASRDLATTPASTVQRSTFLREADSLAARFRELDSQFELMDNETRQAVESDIGKLNSLTAQLAQLNRQMTKHATVSKQPAELLDQRDKLLRDLSALTAIRTRFSDNGAVLVSVGDVISQGVLVEGNVSREIGLSTAQGSATGKLQFVIDPYGNTEPLPNLLSGSIGGTLSFREHILAPASDGLASLAQTLVREVNRAHRGGIDSQGRLGGDLLKIESNPRGAAAGISVAIQDASRVAAAGQFRAIDDPLNTSVAQPTVRYADRQFAGAATLYKGLSEGLRPQLASERVVIPAGKSIASLGTASVGARDLVLALESPGAGQSLQVFTRDGRQLLGTALSADQKQFVMDAKNGMEPGAQFDASSLNTRFLGMDLFLGARGGVQEIQQFDADTGKVLAPTLAPAVLQGRAIAGGIASIAANTYRLNGVSLGALDTGSPLTAEDIAGWLQGYSAQTGVSATVVGGAIRLSRPDGNITDDIRLGAGTAGTAADLAALGFDSAVNLNGVATDDLLVFVTTAPGPTASLNVSAQFSAPVGDAQQTLRAQTLEITFSSPTAYRIVDRASQSVVAERAYDPRVGSIQYRGLTLAFSDVPLAGDRFTIDGNFDGIGNNEAMLALAALEDDRLMPGGLTMTEAYIEQVNEVGNMAQQSSISRDALKVVYDQALASRDSLAGVSLDEEAADLVRFQQAYQANARVMQMASDLFDSILQVR